MTPRVPARCRRGERDERGSFTLFTIVWSFLILILAALAIDGGLAIAQRERAADLADQAARTEAQNLSQADLRGTGTVTISGQDGCALAASYIGDAAPSIHYGKASLDTGFGGGTGCAYSTVQVPGPGGVGLVGASAVTVQVKLTYSPFVFDIFGGTITVTESGTAFAQAGD
jgi:Flp pilus assembly protein TadG